MVWEILVVSLKIDALDVPFTEDQMEAKKCAIDYLITIHSIFRSYVEDQDHQKYPSAFLLMYRHVFLQNGTPLTDTVGII